MISKNKALTSQCQTVISTVHSILHKKKLLANNKPTLTNHMKKSNKKPKLDISLDESEFIKILSDAEKLAASKTYNGDTVDHELLQEYALAIDDNDRADYELEQVYALAIQANGEENHRTNEIYHQILSVKNL